MCYEYKKHLLCFLDILGYKRLVDTVEDNASSFASTIRQLENVIKNCIRYEIESYNESSPDNAIIVKFIIFSDSICLFIPIDGEEGDYSFNFMPNNLMPNFPIITTHTQKYVDNNLARFGSLCRIIANIQLKSLGLGIIYRGAISIGNHYYKEDVMFSKALVDAFIAESSLAKYPRVILLKNDILELAPFLCEHYDLLLEEDDDFFFVDYLGIVITRPPLCIIFDNYYDEISNHKKLIELGVELAANDKHILRKYAWMMNYHYRKLGSSYGYYTKDKISISKKHKKICFDKLGTKAILADFKYIKNI